MLERLSRSWNLTKTSASVLRQDKELLVFPAISGLAVLMVSATFLVPSWLSGASINNLANGNIGPVGFLVLFLFYFCQYFVIIFFNTALVGAAMIRFDGGDPTLGDGLRIAKSRLGPILGWTLLAATVGMLLNVARERGGGIQKFVVSIVGTAWNLAVFLVVPVLAHRGLGPIEAVKESASILKRTWGEQVAGNLGIGFAFGVMYFLLIGISIPVMIVAIATGNGLVIGLAVAVLGFFFLLLPLVQAALQGIYSAALYRYATTGEAGQGFEGALEQAFVRR